MEKRGVYAKKRAAGLSRKPKSRSVSQKLVVRAGGRSPPSPAAEAFDDEAEAISQIYIEKDLEWRKSATTCPYDSPISQFKRRAYDLICKTISLRGGHQIIKSKLREDKIYHNGPTYKANPFYAGLRSFNIDSKYITPDTIRFFADQMLYASRNRVPACLLIGFLYQTGSRDRLTKKLKEGALEAWSAEE